MASARFGLLVALIMPCHAWSFQTDADNAPVHKAVKAPPAQASAPEADGDDDDGDGDDGDAQPISVVVRAQRLDAARASIEPGLGAQVYSFSNALVELRPGGETVSLAQVLLQAPGVSQSPSGQLQVRGSSGLQYRINNVIIPEGFTDLAESLNARMEKRIDLVTGALPAQYGLEAGGVVNITTQSGAYQKGGQVELYGGGQGEIEPAIEFADTVGGTNLYVSGSLLQSHAGLPSLDGAARPHHDSTRQADGFGYFEHPLDDQSSLSLILGGTDERFDIPHVRGDARSGDERETGLYGILSYLRTSDRFTYQTSLLLQDSAFTHHPDWTGDLAVDGPVGARPAHHSGASGRG